LGLELFFHIQEVIVLELFGSRYDWLFAVAMLSDAIVDNTYSRQQHPTTS
jgi:hypothetical protein